ncbi:MAG TPA: DinB family protein [Planctomycetota bacterium]|nr:DinB family protein [Planctomycetota bacterium]
MSRVGPPAADLDGALARQCCALLREVYLSRLEQALAGLTAADLWWRPHPDTTSIGNLLLHLDGNVRQWIVSGLGGAPDQRVRESEFAAHEGAEGSVLLAALSATVAEACAVIERLPRERWMQPVTIQDFEVTVLAAVLHIVEHFSWHCGQVTWIAKLRRGAGHGLSYYDDDALNAARNAGGGAGAPDRARPRLAP